MLLSWSFFSWGKVSLVTHSFSQSQGVAERETRLRKDKFSIAPHITHFSPTFKCLPFAESDLSPFILSTSIPNLHIVVSINISTASEICLSLNVISAHNREMNYLVLDSVSGSLWDYVSFLSQSSLIICAKAHRSSMHKSLNFCFPVSTMNFEPTHLTCMHLL